MKRAAKTTAWVTLVLLVSLSLSCTNEPTVIARESSSTLVSNKLAQVGIEYVVAAAQRMLDSREQYLATNHTWTPGTIISQEIWLTFDDSSQHTNIPPEISQLSPEHILIYKYWMNIDFRTPKNDPRRLNALIFTKDAPHKFGTIQLGEDIWFWNGKDTTGEAELMGRYPMKE